MPGYKLPLSLLIKQIRKLRQLHQQYPESTVITQYLEQIENMYFIRTGHILL